MTYPQTIYIRSYSFFFFNDTATTEIYTLSLHDALPIFRDPFFLVPETELPEAMRQVVRRHFPVYPVCEADRTLIGRSEEHTSELQSLAYLVCRLLLEKKKKKHHSPIHRLEDDLRYSIRV